MDDEGVVGNETLAPEVGTVVFVSGLDSGEGSLDEVASGSGGALGFGVDISDTCEVEQFLGDGGSDQPSSSGGGHQSNFN